MSRTLKPLIKVCGMRDTKNIEQLVSLHPDFIGFILYPKSKRFLGENYILTANIPSDIKRVGVFVNATQDEVSTWTHKLKLDLVQLHGNETPEYCAQLHARNVGLIKAFGIDENFNFSILKEYAPYCEYFLFDTKTPLHGGSGKQFDWKILEQYIIDKPIFLSGGIGPDDVNALKKANGLPVYAVDINSKFEEEPAQKNIVLLKKFITDFRK